MSFCGCQVSLLLSVVLWHFVSVLEPLAARVTYSCVRCIIILTFLVGHQQLEHNRMTNRGQVVLFPSSLAHESITCASCAFRNVNAFTSNQSGYVDIVINAAARRHLIAFRWAHGEMWKDKTIKSFSSFSRRRAGCSAGSAWFGMTASLTCVANLLYSLRLK